MITSESIFMIFFPHYSIFNVKYWKTKPKKTFLKNNFHTTFDIYYYPNRKWLKSLKNTLFSSLDFR